MWAERERNISKDAMLCDGTPRREKGYRAHVMMRRVRSDNETLAERLKYLLGGSHGLPATKRLYISPLFPKRDQAEAWTPTIEV